MSARDRKSNNDDDHEQHRDITRKGNPVGTLLAVIRLPKPLLCPMILAHRQV